MDCALIFKEHHISGFLFFNCIDFHIYLLSVSPSRLSGAWASEVRCFVVLASCLSLALKSLTYKSLLSYYM